MKVRVGRLISQRQELKKCLLTPALCTLTELLRGQPVQEAGNGAGWTCPHHRLGLRLEFHTKIRLSCIDLVPCSCSVVLKGGLHFCQVVVIPDVELKTQNASTTWSFLSTTEIKNQCFCFPTLFYLGNLQHQSGG